jgi:hypothetical protein
MELDIDGARRALARLGEPLSMSVEQVAWGIHQIVNENIANAARAHLASGAKIRAVCRCMRSAARDRCTAIVSLKFSVCQR